MFYLQLYKRVKRWKALPGPGGVLDQDEEVMHRLDTIADLVDEHEAKESKVQQQRMKNAQFLQGGQGLAPGQRPQLIRR